MQDHATWKVPFCRAHQALAQALHPVQPPAVSTGRGLQESVKSENEVTQAKFGNHYLFQKGLISLLLSFNSFSPPPCISPFPGEDEGGSCG